MKENYDGIEDALNIEADIVPMKESPKPKKRTERVIDIDKDVQKVLAEAEEAVAAAELAAGKQPQPAKAEELARLQDEELLAKGESVCVLFPCCYISAHK